MKRSAGKSMKKQKNTLKRILISMRKEQFYLKTGFSLKRQWATNSGSKILKQNSQSKLRNKDKLMIVIMKNCLKSIPFIYSLKINRMLQI